MGFKKIVKSINKELLKNKLEFERLKNIDDEDFYESEFKRLKLKKRRLNFLIKTIELWR